MRAIRVGFAVLTGAFLAPAFLLAAISFALTSGDLVNQQQIQTEAPVLKLAGNVATVGFLILESAATWALVRISNSASSSKIRLGGKAAVIFAGLCLFSYAITLAAMKGFAPDLVLDTAHTVGAWIIRALR